MNKASKCPSTFPLPTKQAEEVFRELLQSCLTYKVPNVIRYDGGKEPGATLTQHLSPWSKTYSKWEPADDPQDQGIVEQLGGWSQEVLSEFYPAWSMTSVLGKAHAT